MKRERAAFTGRGATAAAATAAFLEHAFAFLEHAHTPWTITHRTVPADASPDAPACEAYVCDGEVYGLFRTSSSLRLPAVVVAAVEEHEEGIPAEADSGHGC